MCFMSAFLHTYTPHGHLGSRGGQKRTFDAQELELKATVVHLICVLVTLNPDLCKSRERFLRAEPSLQPLSRPFVYPKYTLQNEFKSISTTS